MNLTSWLLLIGLAIWLGASIWRWSGMKLMHRIEEHYLAHHLQHLQDPHKPPVRWDFEQDALVPVMEEEVEAGDDQAADFRTMAIRDASGRLPVKAIGLLLARIPAGVFHGTFGLLLLAIWGIGRLL